MDQHAKYLEQERLWLKNVYQGDKVPQFTARALITGMLLGGIMSLSNLYVSLKTGWSLGVSITSCILAFAMFSTMQKLFPDIKPFSTLENYTAQSAAASAAVASSAGLSSAVPALYMVSGRWMTGWELGIWISAISLLGVVMAIPMKRQMINIEQLKFPSGIATAETLKSLHGSGAEALEKARSLLWSGGIGVVVAWFRDATFKWMPFNIPANWYPSLQIRGIDVSKLTLGFEGSLIMIAAGAIMGMRVAISMLLGAIVNYAFIAPWLINSGIIDPKGGLREISGKWSVWPGVAIMVSSSLLAFAFQWRTILRAFSGIGKMFGAAEAHDDDPLTAIECPNGWFVKGFLLAGFACVVLQIAFFDISWWMATIAVVMTFFLCIVAGRATGETDITPIGAMGKITQLTYGILSPGNMTANLMTANVTGGCASHSADLLMDLKSGYLLGANPRKQFLAQLLGVLAGSVFAVPAYQLILTPENLGSEAMPAPAAMMWRAVAEAFSKGIGSLHPTVITAIYAGLAFGAVIALLEHFVPKSRPFLPSPTGFGIAFVISGYNSISMFIGAVIVYILAKAAPKLDEKYTIPVSSGLIAGESLMGVLIAALVAFGYL